MAFWLCRIVPEMGRVENAPASRQGWRSTSASSIDSAFRRCCLLRWTQRSTAVASWSHSIGFCMYGAFCRQGGRVPCSYPVTTTKGMVTVLELAGDRIDKPIGELHVEQCNVELLGAGQPQRGGVARCRTDDGAPGLLDQILEVGGDKEVVLHNEDPEPFERRQLPSHDYTLRH